MIREQTIVLPVESSRFESCAAPRISRWKGSQQACPSDLEFVSRPPQVFIMHADVTTWPRSGSGIAGDGPGRPHRVSLG